MSRPATSLRSDLARRCMQQGGFAVEAAKRQRALTSVRKFGSKVRWHVRWRGCILSVPTDKPLKMALNRVLELKVFLGISYM